MERVVFLIEETNQRFGCLLNPESLVVRRVAGVRPRRAATGSFTGNEQRDDPLLFTGGGRTEIDVDLLFDVTLSDSSVATEDVRELTGPLWDLAENGSRRTGHFHPPLVRLIWGKSWNVPGVVVSVAERLEQFTGTGLPQRSWLRMRLFRVTEPPPDRPVARPTPIVAESGLPAPPEGGELLHPVIGGSEPGERQEGLFASSADLIASALAEVSAMRVVATAREEMGSADSEIRSGIESEPPPGETPEETAEREQRAAEVDGALVEASTAIEQVTTSDPTNVVQAMLAASVSIDSASVRIEASVAPRTAERERPGFLRSALRKMRDAGDRLRRTAAAVAIAVRRKAFVVYHVAVRTIGTAADAARAGMARIAPHLEAGGKAAADLVRSAVETVRSSAKEAWSRGETLFTEHVPAAMEKLGTAAEAFWSTGAHAAARVAGRTAEVLSDALKHARIAAESLASVTIRKTGDAIRTGIDLLRAALEGSGKLAAEAIRAVREAVMPIRSALASVAHHPEAARVPEVPEIEELLDAAIERLEDDPAAARKELSGVIERIETSVAALIEAEDASTAEVLRTAVEELPPEAAPSGEIPAAPLPAAPLTRERLRVGERLDQLAFRFYRDPAFWRLLAVQNEIDDPLRLPAGLLLRVPPLSGGRPS